MRLLTQNVLNYPEVLESSRRSSECLLFFVISIDNDHRMAKSIGDPIDFAAKRQVWQRMIHRIIRPMLIAMSIWQNSKAVLLRRKAARRKAFWLFAIL